MLFSLTNPEIAILMMGLFLFAVLLGFPIAFTLMAMGIGFGYYAYYDPALMDHIFDNRIFSLFVKNTYTVMDNNVLTAVPLFLFMGYLVERAGIVSKLFFAKNNFDTIPALSTKYPINKNSGTAVSTLLSITV